VCEMIDDLFSTLRGYQCAKIILKSNHGRTSAIMGAYIDNINTLLVISGSQPNEIHKFS